MIIDEIDVMDEKEGKEINSSQSESMRPDLNSEAMVLKATQEKIKDATLYELEPSQCIPWKFRDRDPAWLTVKSCSDLIHSIKKMGQLHPILVREIKNDPHHKYEIIYGARRWFSCLQILNQLVSARITTADDKTCLILMHAENANSKDITEFERACSFYQQMTSGIFKNQYEMAEAMGISQGLVSRMINSAKLFDYPWIKALFSNKLEIKIKPAHKLVSLLKNKNIEPFIKACALEIENRIKRSESFSTKEIFDLLISAGKGIKTPFQKNQNVFSVTAHKHIYCKREPSGKMIFSLNDIDQTISREILLKAFERIIDEFIFIRH